MFVVSASRTMANAHFRLPPPKNPKIPLRRQKLIEMSLQWREREEAKRCEEERLRKREIERAVQFIPADVRAVISEVGEKHGLTIMDIISRENVRTWSAARKEAIRAVKAKFGFSSPVLGRYFRRDHASILYSLGTIQR